MTAISIAFNEHYEKVMARYPDKYFDLANCDIPWGINVGNMAFLKEMKATTKQKNGSRLTARKKKEAYEFKDWDLKPPPQKYFDEVVRVSKHQIIFGIEYVNWSNVGSGRIIWDKLVPEGMGFSRYEIAYCSMIEDTITIPLLWSGMIQAKSLSEPTIQQGNKKLNEKRIHPCHKPILLYDAIYSRFGFERMKVIDTHLGGGSNRISCEKLHYDFVAAEIDKGYFDKQERRFKEHLSILKLPGF